MSKSICSKSLVKHVIYMYQHGLNALLTPFLVAPAASAISSETTGRSSIHC